MELSKRLRAVAGLVTEGASVADIGTDHGYIPICLAETGRAGRIIAADINPGPLSRARVHIEERGLQDRIETRLSDGLREIGPGEADTVIAAGMGGNLVIRILQEGRRTVRNLSFLILQPQSEIGRVRRYLDEQGMWIEKEDMVEEEGKYYPVMRVVPFPGAAFSGEFYEEWEYLYGKRLLEARHPVLFKYLQREAGICETIIEELKEQGKSRRARRRIQEIRRRQANIKKALSCYEEK